MSEPEAFEFAVSEQVRAIALGYPSVTEGSSCVNRAFKAAGKNFAFLGEKDGDCRLRVKLGPSLADVTDDPIVDVGSAGWTMVQFSGDDPPDLARLERWVDESYRLLAPKKLVALLDAGEGEADGGVTG